jgi:hypothetical protein
MSIAAFRITRPIRGSSARAAHAKAATTQAACIVAMLLGPSSFASSSARGESSVQRDLPRPSLLLGGEAASAPASVPLDPLLPSGAEVRVERRPASASAACALREPLCVHHDGLVSAALAHEYARALERARRDLVYALGLPAPLPDMALGPTAGLDFYLSSDAPLDVHVGADVAFGDESRRSGFCVARPSRAEARRQAAQCVAGAVLLGVDAGETPFLRRAIAGYLATLLIAPTGRDLAAVDVLQANPQLSIAGRDDAAESAGALLLFEYVDARLAAGEPGLLPVALAQLARSATLPGQPRYHNEPDLIDVLRGAFAGSASGFEDFMLGFAVERAFIGARDDGRRHPTLAWLGDVGRVRFDWVLTASSLPRRVAPRRPLEAFGCAYTWLELDRVTLGKALAFRAEWEAPATFRWALLTIDARGQVLGRFDLPYVQNATAAERAIEDYDGAVGVLVAGINLGGVDLAHPFDPDHEPSEPHGFTLYLTEL